MKNAKSIIFNLLGYIITLTSLVIYIVMAVVAIKETNKTFWQIVGESVIVLVLGMLVKILLGYQGDLKGESTEIFKNTRNKHAERVDMVDSIWHLADQYCDYKNRNALKTVRRGDLIAEGLKYEDHFDNEGNFIEFLQLIELLEKPIEVDKKREVKKKNKKIKKENRIIRKKNKCIKKAIKIRITTITPSDLTSHKKRDRDPLYSGKTKVEYNVQSLTVSMVFTIIIALIGGFYMAKFIGWNIEEVLLRVLIASLALASGFMTMYSKYSFIKGPYREKIVTAVDRLTEFDNLVKNGTIREES